MPPPLSGVKKLQPRNCIIVQSRLWFQLPGPTVLLCISVQTVDPTQVVSRYKGRLWYIYIYIYIYSWVPFSWSVLLLVIDFLSSTDVHSGSEKVFLVCNSKWCCKFAWWKGRHRCHIELNKTGLVHEMNYVSLCLCATVVVDST